MIANEGGLTTLGVYVSGNPMPDVYWRKGRADIDTRESRFRILAGGSLQVSSVLEITIFLFWWNLKHTRTFQIIGGCVEKALLIKRQFCFHIPVPMLSVSTAN